MLSTIDHRDPHGKGHHDTDTQYTAAGIRKMYRQQNKLGVPDMRKMMKTIVAEVFPNDKFDPIHKCRGFWQKKPEGWPELVPFLDPNNAKDPKVSKTQKPPKKDLAKMMKFCVEQYEKMHHLVPQEPFIPQQLEPEPPRQTDYGNIHMQATDYQQPNQQPMYLDTPSNYEKPLDQIGGVGVMEEGGPGSSHVTEEGNFNLDGNFDIVHYVDETLEALDEEGPNQVNEINLNVQVSQNDETQLVTGPQMPAVNTFPPAPSLPPVNQQMQGLSVSNSGHVATDHTTAPAQFGGGQGNAEDVKPMHVSQDLFLFSTFTNPGGEDAQEFDEIPTDGNIEIDPSTLSQLLENSGIGDNQEVANSFDGLMNWPAQEGLIFDNQEVANSVDGLMNWPAEEGLNFDLPFAPMDESEPMDESDNSAPMNEACIPTVVNDYSSDEEDDY